MKIAQNILDQQKQKAEVSQESKYVFASPAANGVNKVLGEWIKSAGIEKDITWSFARLRFSILLKDQNVDDATVAYLMGHNYGSSQKDL